MSNNDEIKKFNQQIESYIANKANRSDQTAQEEIVTDRQGFEVTKSEAEEKDIDYLTSSDPSVDTENETAKKKSFGMLMDQRTQDQKLVGYSAGQRSVGEFMPAELGIGDSKWDYDESGYLTVDQALDINNIRGERQSNVDKWGNGILKFVGKTLTQTVGGTIGAVYGLGAGMVGGISNGDWTQFYNNGFAHGLDDIDAWMDGKLPNYYTDFEREAKFWKKLGHANFWSDGVGNGLSFLAGAVTTELIWASGTAALTAGSAPAGGIAGVGGAMGLIGNTLRILQKGKRILKGLDRAADAKKIHTAADKFIKGKRAKQALTTVRQLYTGASYEAGIEARHHYKTLKEDLTAKWQRENEKQGKGPLTQEDINEIERITRSKANAVFGMNLALVGGSNMLMLGKLYGPGLGIQKGLMNQIRKINPNFMRPVNITGKTAEAAFKGNRLLQSIGMSQKWAERTNKLFNRAGATLGVPFYEGFIEEGGQKIADLAMHDHALAKYSAPGQKNTVDLIESFVKAMGETYGSDDGMTEVMTGFILGLTGLPGYGHGKGNLLAIQQRLQNVTKREGVQESIAEFYNNNSDLLQAIKANSEFNTEMYVLTDLMDKALVDNNDAEFKNLENDKMYSYVKAKYITGQFADIAEDADSIRKMSNEDFLEMFGYEKSSFKDENDITKRKNKVADDVIKRSQKIKEAYEKVDAMREWGNNPLADDTNGVIRDELVHSLATIDNVAEREANLLKKLAEMTGGTVKERQRGQLTDRGAARTLTYTDPVTGKTRKFEPGDFTRGSIKWEYNKILEILEEDAKAPADKKKLTDKQREDYKNIAEALKSEINSTAGAIDFTELSREEMEILEAMSPAMKEWVEKEGEVEATRKLQEVIKIIKDLRHLRGRRQNFINKFNHLAYNENTRKQRVQAIEAYAETKTKDEQIPGILEGKAKELYMKYGTTSKFKVTDENGNITFYRFNNQGDLMNDKTGEIADATILEGINDSDVLEDSIEDAKKALKAIKALKQDKGKEIEELRIKIQDTKKKLGDLADLIVKKQSAKTGDVTKILDDLTSRINRGKKILLDLETQRANIAEELQFLETFIRTFYDVDSNRIVPMTEIEKTLKEWRDESGKRFKMNKKDMANMEKLEAKVQEIMAPIIEWSKSSIDSINIVNEKLNELREHKNLLQKVLFDKLRSRKSNVLKGQKATNFEELYTNILNELDTYVKNLESKQQKQIPFDTQGKIHNQILANLPAIKKELSKLQNMEGFETYEGYKEMIEQYPDSFPNLYLKGLNVLDKVEAALQDKRFNASELAATESEIQDFQQIRNDLVSAREEADVDNQTNLAHDLLQAAKLQDAYNQVKQKILELEQALQDKVRDTETVETEEDQVDPTDEPSTDDPATNEVIDDLNKVKPINKGGRRAKPDKNYSQDISIFGTKAAGNWRAAKLTLEKYALKDKDGNIIYDENGNIQPRETLNAQQKLEYRNAKRQLNAFDYFSKMKMNNPDLSKFTLRPVLSARDGDHFKGSFFTNKGFKDEGDTSNPLSQHIHLALIGEDGKGVRHNGEFVYLSLPAGIDPNIKDLKALGKARGFTNHNGLNTKQVRQIFQDFADFRSNILNGKIKSLKLSGMTRGAWTLNDNDPLRPVSGRALPDGVAEKDAKIIVATTKKGEKGPAKISLQDGGQTMDVPPGFTYIHLGNQLAPLLSRHLTQNESDTIIKLLQKYENNYANLVQSGLNRKVAFRQAELEGMETTGKGIKDIIEGMVDFGKRTSKRNPKYAFYMTAENGGGYIFGVNEQGAPNFISNNQLRANDEKAISKLRSWLLTRNHNIENKKLNNKKAKYLVPVLDDALNIVKNVEYANYEEYLLKERGQDSPPPVMTKMPLISSNILAPSFRHVYPKYTIGPGIKKADPTTVKEESIVPEVPTESTKRTEEDIIKSLETDLKEASKNNDKARMLQIEKALNARKRKTNSLNEKFSKFSKKQADEKIAKIKEQARKNREKKEDDDVNMLAPDTYTQEDALITEDLKKEIAKVKKILPQVEFKIVDGFIKGNSPNIVGQVKGYGNILVSNLGPGGVVYHEAFHQVSLFMLPTEAQAKMYNAVRTQDGKVNTYKGKTKKFSELTDKEAEEYLAEEFRKYILTDGAYKQELYSPKAKTFLGRVFQKLRSVLRSLLGLDTKLEPSVVMAPVAKVFEDIKAGKYADASPIETKDLDAVANMALLPKIGAKDSMDIVDVMTSYFSQELFYGAETSLNVNDIELLTSPERKQEFTVKVNNAYDQAFIKILDDLASLYTESEGNIQSQQEIYNTIDYIEKHKDEIINVHRLWLNTIGLNFSLEYDMVAEENAKNKYMYEMFNNNEFSSVTLARPAVKLLVGTLPNMGTVNSTGLTPAVDFKFAMNYLHKNLAGITDQHAQIAKLKTLTAKQPWVKELLNRLNVDNVDNTDLDYPAKRLQVQFWQQFSQPKNKYNTLLLDSDNNLYSVDANKSQVYEKIKSNWKNNLLSKVGQKDSIVSLEEGQFKIDINSKIVFPSKNNKKFSIKDFKEDKVPLDAIASLELFEALGLTFSDRQAMLDPNNKTRIQGDSFIQIIQDAAEQFVERVSNDSVADIFDEDNVDISGRLGKLIEAELYFNQEANELRHLGADNKPRHGISLPTHIDQVMDSLSQNIIPDHLNPTNNPYTANSIIIKALNEGKKITAQVSHLEGSRVNKIGEQGKLISNLSPSARLSIYTNSILSGVHPLFRAADTKQERGIDLGTDSVIQKFEDAQDILLGYVEDEINTVLARNLTGYGKDIVTYQTEGTDLRIFNNILNQNPKLSDNLEDVLRGDITVNEFWKDNTEEVVASLRKYIADTAKESLQVFEDNKALEKVNSVYINNLISNNHAKKLLGSKNSRTLTKQEVNKLMEILTINDFIGSVEQTKLIFGDLANYNKNDFFKRTKLVIGAKRLALANESINEFLNTEANQRLDGKVVDGTANVMVFNEPISESLYAPEYMQNGVQNAEEYLNMKEADGHAFANMHFYREFLMRTGDWTNAQEEIYQTMYDKDGNFTNIMPENIRAAFPTIKPQYFGPQLVNSSPSLPLSLKFSLSPIIPLSTLLPGSDGIQRPNHLSDLMNQMERKSDQIDMVLFPSAAKLGHKVNDQGVAPNLYNETGKLNIIPKGKYNTIYLEHLGIQLDISQETKDKVSKGTQITSIVLADQGNSPDPEIQDAVSEYINLQNSLVSQNFDSLLNKLNIKRTENPSRPYSITDKSKLIQIIQEEVARRKYPENIAEGINRVLAQVPADQKFDILVNKSDIERLLFSMLDSQVIRKKFKGDLRVQQSALGYNVEARTVKQEIDGSIKLYSGTSLQGFDTLKFYSKQEDGVTSSMEVYMPAHFADYMQAGENLIIKPDGVYVLKDGIQNKIANNDLLDLIGFRIPTDGFHSIDFIKIKGFLPREAGPIVVVPAELTTKVGMDFDIDKFSLYFPSYRRMVNGTLTKRKYLNISTVNEDGTSSMTGLKQYYDEIYGPTLEFFKEIDRSLAEAGRNRPDNNEYDPVIENMMKSIFGEAALDFTADESATLIKTFEVNKKLTPRQREDFAISKYLELKERINEIPSFEDWVKENKDKSIGELNHPGAVQNRIMELQKFILSHPTNYRKLLEPTSTAGAKAIAENIRVLKGEQNDDSFGWDQLLSFAHKQKVASRMWAGMDALGIFAVNNTHHVKAQLADLRLKGRALYVDGFKGNADISMGKVYDSTGNRITDTLGQLLNAAADVSKDPFLFDLNITPQTGNVAMLLIRAGVPLDWTAAFLNQPIIKRYLELTNVNNNPLLEEKDRKAYQEEIFEQLELEYLGPKDKRKDNPTTRTSIYFNIAQLENMIPMSVEQIKNEHLNTAIDPQSSPLNMQIQILQDYFRYRDLGDNLSSLTRVTSYDTNPPMNRHHAILLNLQTEKELANSEFENSEKIITGTHLKSLHKAAYDSVFMFQDMFELQDVMKDMKVYNIINTLDMTEDQYLKFFEKFENDLVTALLTKSLNLESRMDELFFGENSLANRIQRLKSSPKYAENKFIKDLLPIIRTDRSETDNVKYYSMLRSTFEKNVSRDAFFELPQELQNDIIDFSILQGGLNFSDVNLLRLVPNELYVDKAIKILNLARGMKAQRDNLFKQFGSLFYRNNWNDSDIVPRLSSKRFSQLRYSTKQDVDKFVNYKYIAVPNNNDIDLYYRSNEKVGGKYTYYKITKLGNGRLLKEYIEPSLDNQTVDNYKSIVSRNNLPLKPDQSDITNMAEAKVNLKDNNKAGYETQAEMDLLKQQDRENSKDCK